VNHQEGATFFWNLVTFTSA